MSAYELDAQLFQYVVQSEDRDAHWTGVPMDTPSLHGGTMRVLARFAVHLAPCDNARGTNPKPRVDGNADRRSRPSSTYRVGIEDVVAVGSWRFAVEVLVTGRLRWAPVWPRAAFQRRDQVDESVEGGGSPRYSAGKDASAFRTPSMSSNAALRNTDNQGRGSAACNSIR